MPLEIERRFLVTNEGWRKRAGEGARIQQGYIAIGDLASVRVRIRGKSKATLTVKSRTSTARRLEFEYAIPCEDAVALLPLCLGSIIEKVRYLLRRRHLTWEIDVFEGQNAGLIIAEVELRDEKKPLDREASHDDIILWLAYKEAQALIKFEAAVPPKAESDKN